MKNGYMSIVTSRSMRLFLSIVLAFFIQASPFYHLHHFHENGLMECEIWSHASELVVEHSPEHQHHDDQDLPHTNDHKHTDINQIDWNIVRTQSQRFHLFDSPFIFSSISSTVVDDKNRLYIECDKPSNIQIDVTSPLIIRGPPRILPDFS